MCDREHVHLKGLFCLSWSLLVPILTSQADPPTFKNLDFILARARFLKNQGLETKAAIWTVLGLSWSLFGALGGPLGGSFAAFAGSKWHPEFSKPFTGKPLKQEAF